MKKYKVQIKGATPILLNRYSHELNKEKEVIQKDKLPEWEEENWRRKANIDNDNVILPDTYVTGTLRSGAYASGLQVSKKKGKKTISKSFIDGNILMEENPNNPIILGKVDDLTQFDCNVKINKSTIMTIRPKLDQWECEFNIIDLNEMFNKDELKRLFTYCGKFIGIGDWRPKFGRFELVSIDEV